MAKREKSTEAPRSSGATVGYEAQLWRMADALRGEAAGGDARTPPGPRVRSLLRFIGHVRAVDGVRARARHRQRQCGPQPRCGDPLEGRYLDLRSGVQLHHLAAGQDEPRHPRHRGPDRPRRHLPQRPPSGPQGRLHPRESAVQRLRLGRRAPARRQALAVRRAARGQRELRLGAAHRASPRARRRGRFRARQRLDVLERVRGEGDPQMCSPQAGTRVPQRRRTTASRSRRR